LNENLKIKENLKKVLKEQKKTTKQILEEAGIRGDLFFQYLSAPNRRIPAIWIGKIAKTLNISTDEILLKD
jgi:hypothetical protein